MHYLHTKVHGTFHNNQIILTIKICNIFFIFEKKRLDTFIFCKS
jgi:hypothetical protein